MNDLVMTSSTLTSMEVAEMVEKEHKELLRDIRRYTKQINEANRQELGERKIALTDFWEESTYLTRQNKPATCYLVTKQGCEFIAHKTTGVKGTVFTARYIKRFHDMENVLSSQRSLVVKSEAAEIPSHSATEIPMRSDWYGRNEKRIRDICKALDIGHRELYHQILSKLGKTFDIEAANEIYRRERGFYPRYAIDIVGYFSQLEKEADIMLDKLEALIEK